MGTCLGGRHGVRLADSAQPLHHLGQLSGAQRLDSQLHDADVAYQQRPEDGRFIGTL